MSAPAQMSPVVADALLEFVNIGVGRAARGLSELTAREVTIAVPALDLLNPNSDTHLGEIGTGVTLRISQAFSGEVHGQALLVLNRTGAIRLSQLLLEKSPTDEAFDDQEQGALLELGNIIVGHVMGMLADELNVPIHYDLPQLQLRGIHSYVDLISDLTTLTDVQLIIMRASLSIDEDQISGHIILVLPESGLHGLITQLTCLTSP